MEDPASAWFNPARSSNGIERGPGEFKTPTRIRDGERMNFCILQVATERLISSPIISLEREILHTRHRNAGRAATMTMPQSWPASFHPSVSDFLFAFRW
jgi:hypothetical protein